MMAAGQGKIAVAVPRLLPAIMGMGGQWMGGQWMGGQGGSGGGGRWGGGAVGGGSRGNYRERERNRSREPPLLSLEGQLWGRVLPLIPPPPLYDLY